MNTGSDLGSAISQLLNAIAQQPVATLAVIAAFVLSFIAFVWSIRTVRLVGFWKSLTTVIFGLITFVFLATAGLVAARYTVYYIAPESKTVAADAWKELIGTSATVQSNSASPSGSSSLTIFLGELGRALSLPQLKAPPVPPQPQPQPTPQGQSFAPQPQQPSTSTSGRTYVVQAGDTMFRIAQMFGSTVDAIAVKNGILNPSQIQVGMTLVIP